MGLFNRAVKISEGKKYDTNSVSADGVTQEESIKKKVKLKELFKAFDLNNDGTLDKMELALAMDAFSHYDEDGDGKISSKEFKEAAEKFNTEHNLEGKDALSGKDIRKMFKNIMKSTNDDEKVKTSDVLNEIAAKKAEAELKAQESSPVVETAPVEEIVEEPVEEVEEPAQTFSYTVQNGDGFNGLIRRILKAQGIDNPTDEQIKAAKEQFKADNPDAVKTNSKGVEYLLVGAKVNTAADLGDKNNSDEQVGVYADQAAQRNAAAAERKALLERPTTLNIPNKTYNTYEDYVKELFNKEGIKPTKKEIQDRIDELKKLNPNLKDGELLNKTIKTPVTKDFGNAVAQRREERQEQRDLAQYSKTRYEAGKIATKLFDICDNSIGGASTKEFKEAMAQVNPDNIVEVLNKYDEQQGLHKGDTSLMDTIRSEMSNTNDEKQALTQIINNLSDAAKKAGVAEEDIKTAKDSYLNSMNSEYNSIHTVNPKDMEKAVDFLRGAIEAKRQGKNAPKMETTDAMKSFMYGEDGYTMVNNSAQTEYANARKEEGWTAKTGDWVCGLFGCNTIEDMDKKLGKNAAGAHKLLEAAQSGNEAEFKKVYKETFGVEFDENKISARNTARDNLNKAVGLNSTANVLNDIIKNTNYEYSDMRTAIKEKLQMDDETVDAIIQSYVDNSGMKAETDDEKRSILTKFLDDTKKSTQKEFSHVTKGRSIEQMGKDLDLLTKSAYGTNDIAKDVAQFNENQETTEMVTDAAFEIAGTVALQFVPGLGQMAAARLAVSAARWGTRAVKVASYANKAAKGFEAVKKFQTASRLTQVGSNMANAGIATATVNATSGKSAEETLKKTIMNMSFAGVGSGSSILAPKIAQQFGISSKLATEIVEEALNAAGSAGIVTASGGEYGQNQALTDFVTGMVMARIAHVKTDTPEVEVHTPRKKNPPPSGDRPKYVRPENETPFERATRDGNDPSAVAPQGTVGRIGKDKMEGFVDEVSERVKTATPEELALLKDRAGALHVREQRRQLVNIIEDKQMAQSIVDESNLGNLYKLEHQIKQWDDSARDKDGLLTLIAERRAELKLHPEMIKQGQYQIEAELKQNVDAVLSSPKKHMLPDEIHDVVTYIENISDPADFSRVEALLQNKSGTGKKIKQALNAKREELNIRSMTPDPHKVVVDDDSSINPDVVEVGDNTYIARVDEFHAPKKETPVVVHSEPVSTPTLDKFSQGGKAKERSVRKLSDLNFENTKNELKAAADGATSAADITALQRKIDVISDRGQRKALEKILDTRKAELNIT